MQKLSPYDDTVGRNFQSWIMKHHSGSGEKFNKEQMAWLHMIREHIARVPFIWTAMTSIWRRSISYGGMGQMYKLFGERMDGVIEELNEALAA